MPSHWERGAHAAGSGLGAVGYGDPLTDSASPLHLRMERTRVLKERIRKACLQYGKKMEQAKLSVKGSRKLTYVLDWGRIDRKACIHTEKKKTIIVPNNFKVVFEACNNVWIAEVTYKVFQKSAKHSIDSAAYQIYLVGDEGKPLQQGASGWMPNISSAIKQALKNQDPHDQTAASRPNGRLYLGVFYDEAQELLKQVYSKETHRIDASMMAEVKTIIGPSLRQEAGHPERVKSDLANAGRQYLLEVNKDRSEILEGFSSSLLSDPGQSANMASSRYGDVYGVETYGSAGHAYGSATAGNGGGLFYPEQPEYPAPGQEAFGSELTVPPVPAVAVKNEVRSPGHKRVLGHSAQRLYEDANDDVGEEFSSKSVTLEEKLKRLLGEVIDDHNHRQKGGADDITLTSEEYNEETRRVLDLIDDIRTAYMNGRVDLAKRSRKASDDLVLPKLEGKPEMNYRVPSARSIMSTDEMFDFFSSSSSMDEDDWKEKIMGKLFAEGKNVNEQTFEQLLSAVFHLIRKPKRFSEMTRETFRAADFDGSGTLTRDELHEYMVRREYELRQIFDTYDLDGDGYLTVSELRAACKKENLSEDILQAFVNWLETLEDREEVDGKLGFNEFYRGMVLLPPSKEVPFLVKKFGKAKQQSEME